MGRGAARPLLGAPLSAEHVHGANGLGGYQFARDAVSYTHLQHQRVGVVDAGIAVDNDGNGARGHQNTSFLRSPIPFYRIFQTGGKLLSQSFSQGCAGAEKTGLIPPAAASDRRRMKRFA